MRSAILFPCLLAGLEAEKVSYQGDSVLRIQDPNRVVFNSEFNHNLFEKYGDKVEIWTQNKNFTDVFVKKSVQNEFVASYLSKNPTLKSSVMIEDVQQLIDETARPEDYVFPAADGNLANFDYENYHTFEEIDHWIDMMAAEYNFITIEEIGVTHEGHVIKAMKIAPHEQVTRQSFFFNVAIHAREWIATSSMMKILSMMCENYINGQIDELAILNHMDIYVVPLHNIDGYVYSWEHDRMWRKTRTQHDETSGCFGVDGNRNFPTDLWASDTGSSGNPCSIVYRGPEPLSEPCVGYLVSYLETVSKRKAMKAMVDVHSYGQMWIYPYAEKEGDVPNKNTQATIGKFATDAIRAQSGMGYIYGQTGQTLYVATGTTPDYTYMTLKVPCSLTIELRDTGRYGFIIPADQIVPTALETYNAYKVLAMSIKEGLCDSVEDP